MVAMALSNNEAVQNSDYTDEIVATTARSVETDKQAKLKELEDSEWGTAGINWASGKDDVDA
jgi:hypothetical protein